MNKLTYKSAGVDIDSADDFLRKAKSTIADTFTKGVLTGIGHFGAFFQLDLSGLKQPVLVSSTDGVGTKLKVAQKAGIHDTIGQDLVNHCVNDILCTGAMPLYFMDYFAMGKLNGDTAHSVITGLCKAAQENGVAVIGGETAEMPGIYQAEDYDLAGTIVGIVDKPEIINGENITSGEVLIGLPSSGLHTNGYTLARKICFDIKGLKIDDFVEEWGCSVGDELLKIHRSYLTPIKKLMERVRIKGLAHITGGGIVGNTSRIIPQGCALKIDWDAWEVPPVFKSFQEWGDLDDSEMRRTFNLGMGMVIIVDYKDKESALGILSEAGESAVVMGEIT